MPAKMKTMLCWKNCERLMTNWVGAGSAPPLAIRTARLRRGVQSGARWFWIMPGGNVDQVKTTLERVLADEQIVVTQLGVPTLSSPSPPSDSVLGPIAKLSAEFFPGAVVLPTMSPGATDGSYLRNAGIPTYGHSGLAGDVDDVRVHGKDERVLVKSFFDGQEYLYRLVKMLSGGG